MPDEGLSVLCLGQMQGFKCYSRWQTCIILALKVELVHSNESTNQMQQLITGSLHVV
jgi:hypothetical protein